jgi:hypothetical protein
MDKITRKIKPQLKGSCEIATTSSGEFKVEYSGIPYLLDGVATPTLNPDGTAKTNFTTHNLFIPKTFRDQEFELTEINPALVKRVRITEGPIEDRTRDLRVKQLISNSGSAVFCFLCESGELKNALSKVGT